MILFLVMIGYVFIATITCFVTLIYQNYYNIPLFRRNVDVFMMTIFWPISIPLVLGEFIIAFLMSKFEKVIEKLNTYAELIAEQIKGENKNDD